MPNIHYALSNHYKLVSTIVANKGTIFLTHIFNTNPYLNYTMTLLNYVAKSRGLIKITYAAYWLETTVPYFNL